MPYPEDDNIFVRLQREIERARMNQMISIENQIAAGNAIAGAEYFKDGKKRRQHPRNGIGKNRFR
jgi:hypothetical protein